MCTKVPDVCSCPWALVTPTCVRERACARGLIARTFDVITTMKTHRRVIVTPTIYCVSVRPNHSGFTARLCPAPGTEASQRCVYNGATAGAGSDGARATGHEQKGRICRTWAKERLERGRCQHV